MNKQMNYCIILSSEQLSYLADSKYGIDRMKILYRLIEATVLAETEFSKKGFVTTLHIGQAALSEVELSNQLGYDKKTISRLLDKMNQLDIVTTVQSNRTSIHTLKCVSAWMKDEIRIDNPFYVRMKDRHGDSDERPCHSADNNSRLPSNPSDNQVSKTAGNIPIQIADNKVEGTSGLPSDIRPYQSQSLAEEKSADFNSQIEKRDTL